LDIQLPTYQCIYSIKDEAFDTEALSFYDLNILLTNKEFSFLVFDTRSQKALYLEHYTFSEVFSTNQLLVQLSAIYENHHFLKAGYWKNIKLSCQNNKFSLIPGNLFVEEYIKEYVQLNVEIQNENYFFFKNTISALHSENCFAIDKNIKHWFTKSYYGRELKFIHYTSPFLEGIIRNTIQDDEKNIYLNIYSKSITIIIAENQHIEYCNVFDYNSSDDLLYYLMFVMNEFGLNPNHTKVILWGDIDQTSIQFAKLYKYVRYLSLGKRTKSLKFGYVFDELYDHQFFDIYSLIHC
jgi:hypothetical protein